MIAGMRQSGQPSALSEWGYNMYQRIFSVILATAAVAGAQTFPRRATVVGGGNQNSNSGQCTIELVVDGAAEVEIRGVNANLRNVSGQPPQWRRFECTSTMPANPADFRFRGLNGRGKQELVADPRNGGAAVIRIDDSDGGAENYAFEFMWGGGATSQDRGQQGLPDNGGYRGDRGQQLPPDNGGYRADRGQQGPPDNGGYRADRGQQGPPDNGGYRGNRGQPDLDAYHTERDTSFRGGTWRAMFFQRIREDLDHVTSGAFPFTGDRARLERTRVQLDELQQKLARGFYDERQLDEVTASQQYVLQNNRLAARDRAILTDDLTKMRDFRVRHDDYGARDMEGPYHQERDQRFRGNNWQATFFQRIREDLEHVATGTFPFGGDQARVTRTKVQLDELQTKLARGFYDQRELDDVIQAMQGVVASNRMAAHDREILADDLQRMRDFRVRHDQYGAR